MPKEIERQARPPSSGQVQHLLVASSDVGTRDALLAELTLSGDYALDHAASGVEVVKRAEQKHYDAIILDAPLTDMEAYEACRILRRRKYKAPIFLLCSAGNDADVILGLNVGANDCLTKPFSPRVLLARLRAQFKRFEHRQATASSIGPYVLQPTRRPFASECEHRRVALSPTPLTKLRCHQYRNKEGAGRMEIAREVPGGETNRQGHSVNSYLTPAAENRSRSNLPETTSDSIDRLPSNWIRR